MTDLNTQTFDQIVETQATVAQGSASSLVDYSIGSILRAIAEATGSVALWLQALILQLLTTVRASTSTAGDLDSWMADYGVAREAATAATGSETFGRYTATAQATIAPGVVVQTSDGTVQFMVIADTTQAAWAPSLNAYLIPAGTASITATVECSTPGTAGNLAEGSLNALGTAISGVDYCSNAAAFSNGLAAETDIALRARFVAFLASLAKATRAAIGYAIASLQQGYTYSITEFQTLSGTAKAGFFYVVVNDGSGSPSSAVLTNVTTAVDAVRALGIQFAVYAPTTTAVSVSVSVTAAAGYTHATVASIVDGAIEAYIEGLTLGVGLSYGKLYQVIYDASSAVGSASLLTVNGATSDLAVTANEVLIPGTITVN